MRRVLTFLCGDRQAGKSSLLRSLKMLQTELGRWIAPLRKRGAHPEVAEDERATRGIEMMPLKLRKALLTVCDLAGHAECHITHQQIMTQSGRAIYLVLVDLCEEEVGGGRSTVGGGGGKNIKKPKERSLLTLKQRLRYWLRMLRKIQIVTEAMRVGAGSNKPIVILGGTRADQLEKGSSGLANAQFRSALAEEVAKDFRDHLDFYTLPGEDHPAFFAFNALAPGDPEVAKLVDALGWAWNLMQEEAPPVPGICADAVIACEKLRKKRGGSPVIDREELMKLCELEVLTDEQQEHVLGYGSPFSFGCI